MTRDGPDAPLVEVLLATYNGAQHLRGQVDSILAQTEVRMRLVVRDDGSCDNTLDVLAQYSDDPRLHVRAEENVGLPTAFFRLIDESGDDASFWALADQDDVWLPDKLSRAVSALSGLTEPALVCTRVLVVDNDLRPLYPHHLPWRGLSFANALVQNVATGCTIVLNRPARDLLRGRWPNFAVMHDAWIYLVVTGAGVAVYDSVVTVHYRQHASNAVGMGRGPVSRVKGRVRRQLTPGASGAHGRQNAELWRTHGDALHPGPSAELASFLRSRSSLRGRLMYALSGGAHRQTMGSNIVLKILHIVGRV